MQLELTKDNNMISKTCFLLTHVPDPRMNKRLLEYKKSGQVSVVCVRRKRQNIWEPQVENVDYSIFEVDLPSSAQIFKRVIVSSKYQNFALAKLNGIKPSVIYCEGLDSLIIASKYKKKNKSIKVIYEVADLREAYIEEPKNIIRKLLNNVIKKKEKRVFGNVDLLVVTSPLFYDRYYCKLISRSKMTFIPNAPDRTIFDGFKNKGEGPFTIGFIGGIRYLRQMKMLVDVAGELGCKVLFAGAGGTSNEYEEITAYCKDKQNVIFTGRYDYEKEIASLYGKVDCVYAVYDADNPNVRIALPNKLYESIVCELPIIVAKDTYLSELVREWNVGIAVKHDDYTDLRDAINKLMNDATLYESYTESCKMMKDDIFVNDIGERLGIGGKIGL